MKTLRLLLAFTAAVVVALVASAKADSFGSGGNTFNIEFVNIGNPSNAADTTGYGAVSYNYRMGKYAVSQNQMNLAAANGFTNADPGWWTGDEPVAHITWYQAAAFVNWLNTSTGHPAAYNLNPGATALTLWQPTDAGYNPANPYRNSNAYYFLPNEDEYYKAAYYDRNANAGAGGYWLYATGSNTVPTAVASGTAAGTAVYNNLAPNPAAVNTAGGLSPYGTMGQSGNVIQWLEGNYSVPYSPTELRALRGGAWYYPAGSPEAVANLRSTTRGYSVPENEFSGIGFRVASIGQPLLAITLTVSPPETPMQRPATHALEGTFTGGDGSVNEVSFYDNGVFLGTAPVSAPGLAVFNLPDAAAGIHRYTARVSDADETATSNEVEYVVTLAPPPVLSLVAVEDPMPGSALLEGMVLPSPYPATVTVEWGLTTAYGSTVVVNYPFYSIEQPVDILLTGLRADTTYHFRVTAANVDASVTQPDSTFTTAPSPPPVVQVLAQAGIVAGNRIGTDVEDAPGFKLASLGTPSLTNLRRVAVTAVAKDNLGRRMSGIVLGLFEDVDIVHFTMPLRVGGAVPAALGTGLTWKAFPKEPFMDYTDDAFLSSYPSAAAVPVHMGFFGRMSGVGVTTGNDEVLAVAEFQEGDPDQPIIIGSIREGGAAPGVGTAGNPGRYKSFLSAALAVRSSPVPGGVEHSPAMAFTAMLQTGPSGTPGPGGVDKNSDMGLFIFDDSDGAETVTLMLREGQVLGGRAVRSFVALRGPVGHGQGFTADDDPDHFAGPGAFSTTALITFTDGAKQLVAVSKSGVKLLATAKAISPWAGTGPALPWATFPSWFRNGDGRIGVLAALTPGGPVTSANKLRIFAEDQAGDLRVRVATGDVTGDGAYFTGFKAPVMNRDGALAFMATVKTGTATLQRGYYQGPLGLLPFIEQNAAATGANGGVWKTTIFLALPDGMGPLFTAKLRAGSASTPAPGGVTAATDLGLWAVDSFGTTHLLVREGGALAGKTVRTFKALTSVAGSPSQSRSFNGRRDVLVWVLATDFTQHLVHFAVP
jgi:formylglycine-generating enzyme